MLRMNHVHKAIASAIILGIFAALAVIYMTGCASLESRLVGDGKAIAGQIITLEEKKLADKIK